MNKAPEKIYLEHDIGEEEWNSYCSTKRQFASQIKYIRGDRMEKFAEEIATQLTNMQVFSPELRNILNKYAPKGTSE